MFSYFYFLKNSRKGQIFPILVAVAVILVIAALISANLGKVSMDRLHTMNAADAGALAGISDFTCAYNKAWIFNTVMISVYAAIQTYLLIPEPEHSYGCVYVKIWAYPTCWWGHDSIAKIARDVNNTFYHSWRAIVRGYSESVRKDAFYYALINAGIDDKFKWDPDEGRYRDKPHPGEDWHHWQGLKSRFSRWLEELPPGWDYNGIDKDTRCYLGVEHFTSSLSYQWDDGIRPVKSVTVTVTSPNADSGHQRMVLIGMYQICVIIYGVEVPIPIPIPHGRIYAWLYDPPRRYVRVRVERRNLAPPRELGFWRVMQRNTTAEAEAEIIGGGTVQTPTNDFRLRRIR